MLAYYRNLKRFHDLDVFMVHYEGKGRIRWEKTEPKGDPIELAWILRLKEVITWLENRLKGKDSVLRVQSEADLRILSNASVHYASRTAGQSLRLAAPAHLSYASRSHRK